MDNTIKLNAHLELSDIHEAVWQYLVNTLPINDTHQLQDAKYLLTYDDNGLVNGIDIEFMSVYQGEL